MHAKFHHDPFASSILRVLVNHKKKKKKNKTKMSADLISVPGKKTNVLLDRLIRNHPSSSSSSFTWHTPTAPQDFFFGERDAKLRRQSIIIIHQCPDIEFLSKSIHNSRRYRSAPHDAYMRRYSGKPSFIKVRVPNFIRIHSQIMTKIRKRKWRRYGSAKFCVGTGVNFQNFAGNLR